MTSRGVASAMSTRVRTASQTERVRVLDIVALPSLGLRAMSLGSDSDATRIALENAAQHLQRGERPEAAGWYRRAARQLSEEGEDERAVEYARLAADLDDDDDVPQPPKPIIEEPKSAPVRAVVARAKTDGTGKHKAQRRGTGSNHRPGSTGKHRAARDADAPEGVAPPTPAVAPAPLLASPATVEAPRIVAVRSDDTVRTVSPSPSPEEPSVPASSPSRAAVQQTFASVPLHASPVPTPTNTSAPNESLPAQPRSQPPPVPRAPVKSSPPPPPASTRRADSRPLTPPPPPPAPSSTVARVEPLVAQMPSSALASLAVQGEPPVTVLASNPAAAPSSTWSIPPPAPAARRIDYVRAYLPSLHCFDELSTDRVREVARQVQVIEFNDGDPLFTAGDPTGPLLIITSGTAHVDRPGASPFDVVLSDGEMLGVLSVLHADRRLASARARGPLEAFAFAPTLVRSLVREFPTLRRFLHNIAAPRIESLLPHLSPPVRALSSAAQRHLLDLCDCYTVEDGTLLQLEGVPVRALQFVAAGTVEVFGEGVRLGTVRRHGAGTVLGAESMRDEVPARVTVRAAGSTLIARIDRAAYRALITTHPSARDILRDGPGG